MTKISAKLKNKNLLIERISIKKQPINIEMIPLDSIKTNKIYKSNIKCINEYQNNTIILNTKTNSQSKSDNGTILKENVLVYIKKNNVYYYKSKENTYNKLVTITRKIFKISLSKKFCRFIMIAYIYNPFQLKITNIQFSLDNLNNKNLNLKTYGNNKITLFKIINNFHFISFKMSDVLEKESNINNNLSITMNVNSEKISYAFSKKSKFIKDSRFYYPPFKTKFINDYAVHFRRSSKGAIIFVRRKKEACEYSLLFRFLESKPLNLFFLFISRIYKFFNKKPINLYYEKFSSKVEEGAYEIFKLTSDSNNSKNYFIINEKCEDYLKIKNTPNVVKQFSFKYYFLIYSANNLIATEVPAHLNILRTNNSMLRKELCKKKNIFLQHGIIYLKNLGKNSVFITGKDGTFDYIVASSKKEAEVICDTLNVKEHQVLITGLGILSNVTYKHINEKSDDIITIMLTWKPYDEHFEDFTKSSYYINTIKIYELVSKYIKKENINIVAHPKVFDALNGTDLKSNLWQQPISEVLPKSKVMITDYSSVCYNSFYQGAGVIFFQPDLTLYEEVTGSLIPNKDEYIGPRIFDFKSLDNLLGSTISNNVIALKKIRTIQHEKIYKTINEFSDGKNIQRIYKKLTDLKII